MLRSPEELFVTRKVAKVQDGPLISPLTMPASLRSEKIHSSNKESSVDVVASIRGDENAPIHPIDPKVLRRATLKIDFYLIPIIGMFCELSPLFYS